MANSQLSGRHYEYASIDTAPGANGYWCNPVTVEKSKSVDALFFSRSGGGSATPTIQFKLPHDGAAWQDYLNGDVMEQGFAWKRWGREFNGELVLKMGLIAVIQ